MCPKTKGSGIKARNRQRPCVGSSLESICNESSKLRAECGSKSVDVVVRQTLGFQPVPIEKVLRLLFLLTCLEQSLLQVTGEIERELSLIPIGVCPLPELEILGQRRGIRNSKDLWSLDRGRCRGWRRFGFRCRRNGSRGGSSNGFRSRGWRSRRFRRCSNLRSRSHGLWTLGSRRSNRFNTRCRRFYRFWGSAWFNARRRCRRRLTARGFAPSRRFSSRRRDLLTGRFGFTRSTRFTECNSPGRAAHGTAKQAAGNRCVFQFLLNFRTKLRNLFRVCLQDFESLLTTFRQRFRCAGLNATTDKSSKAASCRGRA